jgi:hypothetical protein
MDFPKGKLGNPIQKNFEKPKKNNHSKGGWGRR